MFLALELPGLSTWFAVGAPTDHTSLAMLGGYTIGAVLAFTKEILGSPASAPTPPSFTPYVPTPAPSAYTPPPSSGTTPQPIPSVTVTTNPTPQPVLAAFNLKTAKYDSTTGTFRGN